MYRKLFEHMILIWLAFNLAACAGAPIAEGQIVPLQPAATREGIRAALNAAPGTAVLWKDNLTLVVWRVADGFGFACLDCNVGDPIALFYRLTGGKGNYVLPKTMGEIAAELKAHGWQEVMGSVPAVQAALRSAANATVPLVGLMLLPVGALPPEAFSQEVQQ